MKYQGRIVPAILAKNFKEFKTKIKFLGSKYKLVQLDVMDGKFVKNKTFYNLNQVRKLRAPINYELHLMVKDPFKVIKVWSNFGKLKRVIFHYEAVRKDLDILNIISHLQKLRIQAGLAINPETKLDKIKKFCGLIDVLLVMGVTPGKSGQKFLVKTLDKIKIAKKLCPKVKIEVDGGVNRANLERIINSGADQVASASMVFGGKKKL